MVLVRTCARCTPVCCSSLMLTGSLHPPRCLGGQTCEMVSLDCGCAYSPQHLLTSSPCPPSSVATEAGMLAIREDRDYIVQDDLQKAVRKLQESKKHEGKLDYKAV